METSSTVIEARRGSSISSSNLESVTEEREEAGEYIGEDEEEEDLLAYGDDVYPNMIFKSNPFLVEKPREESVSPELSRRHSLQSLSTRISDPNGEIVKLSLHRTAVRPGEPIFGLLDFRNGVVACTQYAVSLVHSSEKKEEKTLTVSEVCLGLDMTSFEIQPPPEDESQMPSKWLLRFEFVVAPKDFFCHSADKKRVTWKAPPSLKVKTRKWDTPIEILPMAHT